jgi:hypothetical protein
VTKVTFKVFLNQLTAYLEQDPLNYMFLKDGLYSTWSAKQLGKRIGSLAENDTDLIKVKEFAEKKVQTAYDADCAKLLNNRNSQCSRFVQLIAVLCYYTEQDDIDQCSTSFDWIIKYLQKHYNLESRGAHFLDIAALVYKKETQHQTFFKQFRAGFMDNLRKGGEKLQYKNDEVLQADEKMTPTLEATIVLWALERIDPWLPVKVQKNYVHQMVGKTCLVSLQPTIFQNIPAMLQELEEAEPRSSAHSLLGGGENGQHNGSWVPRGGNSRGGRPLFQQSQPSRGQGMGRGTFGRGGSRGTTRAYSKKFCRICYHAGSPEKVFQSHMSCADKTDLRAILGAGEVEDQVEELESRHDAFEAPGWDVEEIACIEKPINDTQSYACSSSMVSTVQLNTITPVPSQVMDTSFFDKVLSITLDSGATLSFVPKRN